jgi:hypothetical protein
MQWIARFTVLLLVVAFVMGSALPAAAQATPSAEDASVAVAAAWFDQILELIRNTPGFTPPVASRALGYAGVTLYEAVAPGIPGAVSLVGRLNEL